MAEVRLSIGAREYIVTCQDGEEQHLIDLGNIVDEKVKEAEGATGGLNESRRLLFASLLLADKLYEGSGGKKPAPPATAPDFNDPQIEQAAIAIEKLAQRLETIADRLEE